MPSRETRWIELSPGVERSGIRLLDARDGLAAQPASVIPLLVYSTYFLLKPFYFQSSGLPQLADFLVVALVAVLLAVGSDRHGPRTTRLLFFASLFVLYAALVNATWALLLGDEKLLWGPVFLLFNLGVFFLCLLMADCYGERFFRYTLTAVAASLLLQVLLSQVVQSPLRRQVIYFENPNQLGYWSILSASIFFLCSLRVRVHWALRIAVACASLYLVALSLSKAAIVAALVLFGLAFGIRPRQLLMALPVAVLVLIALGGSQLYENLVWRLGTVGQQSDDDLAVRGYALLWEFPEYLFFGAGQGAFGRFRVWSDREFHSTLGTILFSYGMVGLALFALLIQRIYRECGLYRCAFLVPAFLYGVTHQGLRFSLLWALFAIAASAVPEPGRGSRPS